MEDALSFLLPPLVILVLSWCAAFVTVGVMALSEYLGRMIKKTSP